MPVSLTLLCVCFWVLAIDGAEVLSQTSSLSIAPVSRTGRISCELQSDGCYKSCTQLCIPGNCSPETCSTSCFKKGCTEVKELVCKDACTGSGNCWSKCKSCCYQGTKKCEPQPCAAVCWAPQCTRLVGSISTPADPIIPGPNTDFLTGCSSWGCKRKGRCYLRCRKRRNSKGVCVISNLCNRRCYRRGCALKPKKCKVGKWGCKRSGNGRCYLRCKKVLNRRGVCVIGNVCNRRCYRRGCGLKRARRCGWGCKRRRGSRRCFRKCRKYRNSKGVCKLSNRCTRRCYRRRSRCGLKSTRPTKCKWTCRGSGRCYTRCRRCCNRKGVCRTGICLELCYPRGCGLRPIRPVLLAKEP